MSIHMCIYIYIYMYTLSVVLEHDCSHTHTHAYICIYHIHIMLLIGACLLTRPQNIFGVVAHSSWCMLRKLAVYPRDVLDNTITRLLIFLVLRVVLIIVSRSIARTVSPIRLHVIGDCLLL